MLYGIPALPVGEHVLSFFVAYLYREGLAPSSVKSYLSAVRHMQISAGLGDPHAVPMPLQYMVRCFKKKGPYAPVLGAGPLPV